jgi:uncharacterized protein YqeY
MRAKDAARLRALRGVLSLVKNRAIELKGEVSEREIATLIQREVKQCKETLEFAHKAERADQVAEHEELLAVLESLLPTGLTDEELASAIRTIITETGATSLGPIMKSLGERYAGRYDGKAASGLARDILAG